MVASLKKQGSNSMPLRHRSDFKQHCLPCNDYSKKQEKNNTYLLIVTSTNNGSWHRVHLVHGGIGKAPGGFLIIQKVKKEVSQVLSERGDSFLAVFGKNLRRWLSRIQFILLQMDRFQLTTVYCNRRDEGTTTSQMTRFRDGKVCNNLATDELTITECSLTTSAYVDYKIQKERTLYLVLRLRCEIEYDTNDNVTTKTQSTFHTAHMNLNT